MLCAVDVILWPIWEEIYLKGEWELVIEVGLGALMAVSRVKASALFRPNP